MACIEDKILGGPKESYCSSSEESAEEQSGEEEKEEKKSDGDPKSYGSAPTKTVGRSSKTGPKGVVEDWRNFKKLQNERRNEGERELRELSKRLSKTCRTVAEDEVASQEEEKLVDLDDEFMKEYTQRRINEMMATLNRSQTCRYSVVHELMDAESYLKAADVDSQNSTVLIHLYEPSITACQTLNGCLISLAKNHPAVKICRVRASVLGTSKKFLSDALPAVQAYRKGSLFGNFVRLADELGDDFFADDLETFLKEYGVLHEISAPDLNRSSAIDKEGEDSDYEID